ncbi:MAG: hypothetical protein GY705_04985 [Bacteroidetes bacterium]|nr:hypothetical protein [Bacteroidota bacterium]
MILPSPDQLRILSVIFFVLLIMLGFRRPTYAVSAYMVLIYCKMSNYYPFFAQIRAELLFGVIILLLVIVTGNLSLNMANCKINKYLCYLVFCVILSFLVAWDHLYSWDIAVYHFIKTLLLYVLILGAIKNKKDLKIFVWSFLFLFLYLSYEPIFGFLTGTGGTQQMYGTNYIGETGILAGHVALANNMNQMLPIAWFLILGSKKKWERIAAIVCFGVFLLALIGSGSRGGIVGMIVWCSLIIWYAKNRVKMIVFFLPLLLFLMISSSAVSTASRINLNSTQRRLTGLSHGIGILKKGNLIGVGPGCYLIARQKYFGYRMESHNIYGQIMGDLGIPGVIVTFLFMREIFRTLFEVKKKSVQAGGQGKFLLYLMIGIQVSLITRLVVSMGSHGLYYFYWYVMAALVVVGRRIEQND